MEGVFSGMEHNIVLIVGFECYDKGMSFVWKAFFPGMEHKY